MRVIPLAPIPAQSLNVVLDGQDCALSVYWRQVRLYLDLDVDGQAVIRGGICQNGANVLQSHSRFFRGSLHFFDAEGQRPPHFKGFGERFFLVFVADGEELPAALRF